MKNKSADTNLALKIKPNSIRFQNGEFQARAGKRGWHQWEIQMDVNNIRALLMYSSSLTQPSSYDVPFIKLLSWNHQWLCCSELTVVSAFLIWDSLWQMMKLFLDYFTGPPVTYQVVTKSIFFLSTDEKNTIVFSYSSWVEKMVVLVHLLCVRKVRRRLWPRHVFCSSALLFLPSGGTAFFILRYIWFSLKYDHVFE